MHRAPFLNGKKPRGKRWRVAATLAIVASAFTFTMNTPAEARGGGGTKAEGQKQAPKRAAAKKSKFQRIAVPAGPLPATVMAALAHAHVPLSSMSVVVERIGGGALHR